MYVLESSSSTLLSFKSYIYINIYTYLYVYIYIHIFICVKICIYICIYIYIYICIFRCISICKYICTYLNLPPQLFFPSSHSQLRSNHPIHIYVHRYALKGIHINKCIYKYTQTEISVETNEYIDIYIYIHTSIHTYIYAYSNHPNSTIFI
jgi:hypothetical protein